MLDEERLKDLRASSELLVHQAEVYRGLLQTDAVSLQQRLGWLNRVSESVRPASPWLVAGALTVGFFAFRRWGKVMRWVPAALSAWRFARGIVGGRG
jgi:hypothetical protein